jgi:hypothetical protein
VHVEAITRLVREVDPADEGDAVVDHDGLLVVAVKRTLSRVQATRDAGATYELVPHPPHLAPGGPEQRQRRSRPGENAYGHLFGQAGEEVAKNDLLAVPRQCEVGREVPPCEMDV